jgi:hypothetical protein
MGGREGKVGDREGSESESDTERTEEERGGTALEGGKKGEGGTG